MSEMHAPEHFPEWNEQMIRRYDPDVFHHHPRGVVRCVEILLGDAEQLPFPSATFDRVIASSLFSHVLHPAQVAAELKRVVKPGGRIVVSVSDEEQIERGLRWARTLRFDRWFMGAPNEA